MKPKTTSPPRAGLPENLKAGVEALSGMSLDDVRVHLNSAKPAQLQAQAHAQGGDIHAAPGESAHLPHEAWHVIQQRRGYVVQAEHAAGVGSVNHHAAGLEAEADAIVDAVNSLKALPPE